jgi:hypothetical protein
MLESKYQSDLVNKTLPMLFPGCVVIKQDSGYMQGVPDLLILWESRWAMLEVKRNSSQRFEANQEYYLDLFNSMSFAACICPENEEEVLYALQRSFKS